MAKSLHTSAMKKLHRVDRKSKYKQKKDIATYRLNQSLEAYSIKKNVKQIWTLSQQQQKTVGDPNFNFIYMSLHITLSTLHFVRFLSLYIFNFKKY